MNINKNVDLGKAFDALKGALIQSREIRKKDNSHEGYAQAFSLLAGTVSGVLEMVEDKDDLPTDLFNQNKE